MLPLPVLLHFLCYILSLLSFLSSLSFMIYFLRTHLHNFFTSLLLPFFFSSVALIVFRYWLVFFLNVHLQTLIFCYFLRVYLFFFRYFLLFSIIRIATLFHFLLACMTSSPPLALRPTSPGCIVATGVRRGNLPSHSVPASPRHNCLFSFTSVYHLHLD